MYVLAAFWMDLIEIEKLHILNNFFNFISYKFKCKRIIFRFTAQQYQTATHHIYINCWFPLYRWSVMEKQVTSTPPPPIPGNGGVLVTCIYITDHL